MLKLGPTPPSCCAGPNLLVACIRQKHLPRRGVGDSTCIESLKIVQTEYMVSSSKLKLASREFGTLQKGKYLLRELFQAASIKKFHFNHHLYVRGFALCPSHSQQYTYESSTTAE